MPVHVLDLANYSKAINDRLTDNHAFINTTINPLYTPEELRRQLNDAGARFILTVPSFLDTVREGIRDTAVEEIFVLGEEERARNVGQCEIADDAGRFAVLISDELGKTRCWVRCVGGDSEDVEQRRVGPLRMTRLVEEDNRPIWDDFVEPFLARLARPEQGVGP